MDMPARNRNTPATDAAFDLLARIAVDPASDERYPDGTVLIPTDSPDASAMLSRALAGNRLAVLVLADGSISFRAGEKPSGSTQ